MAGAVVPFCPLSSQGSRHTPDPPNSSEDSPPLSPEDHTQRPGATGGGEVTGRLSRFFYKRDTGCGSSVEGAATLSKGRAGEAGPPWQAADKRVVQGEAVAE